MLEKNALHGRLQTGILRIEVAALVMLLTALGLVLLTDLYSPLNSDIQSTAESVAPNTEMTMATDTHINEPLSLQPEAILEAQVN